MRCSVTARTLNFKLYVDSDAVAKDCASVSLYWSGWGINNDTPMLRSLSGKIAKMLMLSWLFAEGNIAQSAECDPLSSK